MLTALFGSIFGFIKEVIKTFVVDTMVGFLLKHVGL